MFAEGRKRRSIAMRDLTGALVSMPPVRSFKISLCFGFMVSVCIVEYQGMALSTYRSLRGKRSPSGQPIASDICQYVSVLPRPKSKSRQSSLTNFLRRNLHVAMSARFHSQHTAKPLSYQTIVSNLQYFLVHIVGTQAHR